MRVLTSRSAAVDQAPTAPHHGSGAQPMLGQGPLIEKPIHLSTGLTVRGAGGGEVAEGYQAKTETQ